MNMAETHGTWCLPAKRLMQWASRRETRLPHGCELRGEVEQDLKRLPHLLPVVEEAIGHLRRIFGNESMFAIERFEDPESPSRKPKLFLFVLTDIDAQRASALLSQFDEEWWLDNVCRAKGNLEVSTEFL